MQDKMKNVISIIMKNVREKKPLIHGITNYISANDTANMILACGGTSIMADSIKETRDITSICDATVINIGTINNISIESMVLAGERANELGHPLLLDPVGVGTSFFRTEAILRLLKCIKFDVIKGNISEIKAIYNGCGNTKGVRANLLDIVTENNLNETIELAKNLSQSTGSIIIITGEMDLIVFNTEVFLVYNGCDMMSKISSCGCMLGGIIATYIAANKDKALESSVIAVSLMGICGERAYKKVFERNEGTGSFRTYLIDSMSNIIDFKSIEEEVKIYKL